ncbi:DUF3738 domain-containing protein [Dyadobacter frigoris]|uniref:DUF3738 domain-containing protein n=1 Tax=Dyadobacter frigoris TaxID=2576211 RepID=A0A4U6D7N1_9BACT|nr:DUF3738 domain-containing protein [Dyadobacter frigoris]TKT92237.1 DUF3738 domain-containing protein [Dyadobacter frigoris]GLU53414.1 hypothetical protein Dfri01_28750 [Dyadobacter frigoris]
MQALFKYQMVPHTILIDKDQNIVAITTPDQINETTIQSLLNGQNVNIEVKIDSEFDPEKDYFFANPNIQFSVMIKPYMQGFPSMAKIGQGTFKGRRISFINVLPSMIIRRGYNLTSEVTINEQPKELTEFVPENLICFDIIVPESKKADLDKMMIIEVEKQFPIQSRFVKHKSSVYVLTRNTTYPEICVSNLKEAISFSGRGIEATGAKVDVLKSYIENILGRPVIDESGLEKHYDFIFEILQEDRDNSMKESLSKLGLKLVESERDIDFLTISSK